MSNSFGFSLHPLHFCKIVLSTGIIITCFTEHSVQATLKRKHIITISRGEVTTTVVLKHKLKGLRQFYQRMKTEIGLWHFKREVPFTFRFSQDKFHHRRSCDESTGAHQVSPNLASLDRNSTHWLTRRLHNFSLSPQFGSRSGTATHHWHCQIKTISAGPAKIGANAGICVCYGVVVHPSASQVPVTRVGRFKLPQWP